MWQPSCHHLWGQVIVPLDIFVAKAKLAKQVVWRELPSSMDLNHAHIGYSKVNHAVMIMCADRAK